VTTFFQSVGDTLLGLLFPDRCAACGQSGSLFCPACRASLRPYPAHETLTIAMRTPSGEPPLLKHVTIAFVFEGALREAIHQLKYKRMRRIAAPLAELLGEHIRAAVLSTDALIAVPLHPRRLKERGFNQSAVLAHHLAALSGLPLWQSGLVRQRDTAHQVSLDAQARRTNMQHAFAWQSQEPPPARVLLIDDVVTTGSTLEACAQALHAAGTQEVQALVLARSS
jgi:ComF family protein